MSEEKQDLPRRPEPEIEPGEPEPGGADAVEPEGDPVARDLDPDDNPAVDDVLPDEMKEREDTDTQATRGDGVVSPEEESPA